MNVYLQVITTARTKEDVCRIARSLVEQRLAGCVQIVGPITSTYWWEDEIAEDEEYLCVIKTRQNLFTTVEAAIKAVHPYDVPEILAVPITAGSQNYLDWLGGALVSSRRE
jgi:periplasmic divalent cation tolerance protein